MLRRSNRNVNIPPGNPRAFDYYIFPGSGDFDGKLNRRCKISDDNFFRAEVANCYKQVFGRDGRV